MDVHHCKITFVSFLHNASDVMLLPNHALDDFYEAFSIKSNGLWHVSIGNSSTVLAKSILYDGKGNASLLRSSMTLERKPRYFWITVLFPLLLITAVTLVAPLYPLHTGERTTLLVTSLLASVVYLDLVFTSVPKSSDELPIVVNFIIVMLTYTAFQIGITAFITFFDSKQVPADVSWYRKVSVMLRSRFSCTGKKHNKPRKVSPLRENFADQIEVQMTPCRSCHKPDHRINEKTGICIATNNNHRIRAKGVQNSENEADNASLSERKNLARDHSSGIEGQSAESDKYGLNVKNVLEIINFLISFLMIAIHVILLLVIYSGNKASFC